MSIERGQVLRALEAADHPLGVRELLGRLGLHPGQQTDLKHLLRELVRAGAIDKDGKRFTPPGGVSAPVETGRPDRRGAGLPQGAASREREGAGRRGATSGFGGRGAERSDSAGPGAQRGGFAGRGADRGESGGRGAPRGGVAGRGIDRGESGGRGAPSGGFAGRGADRGASGGRGAQRGGFAGRGGDRGESGGRGAQRGGFGGRGADRGGFDARGAQRGEFDRRAGERGGAAAPRTPEERAEYLDSLRAFGDTVEGILHVHRDGFGFVHPIKDPDAENIFLPPDQASRAMDGDRVIVQVVAGRGGRTAGVVLEVVDRIRQRAVGQYRLEGRQAWVIPNDTSLQSRIRVPPTQLARPGDMVKVVLGIGAAVLEPGVDLFGEVVGAIGRPGEPSAEVLSVAYSNGFNDEFPDEVMAEADHYRVEVSEEEARGEDRRDLRSMQLVTIDGEDARDFDDAVYCERAGEGWRLVVAIADVSHYVREGRPLDIEALHRGTSVYLPDRVLPMLPERLSNGICSLRPDEDRLCMVADMHFDGRAHLRSYELYPAVMRSHARCTYEEVQAVLDGEDVPHRNFLRPHLERLMTLARALNAMRKARGALDFDLPEYKVILDEHGMPERLDRRERKDSHRLVEECMLAANEAVAKFFQDRELPSVYRFHGEPDEDKLEAFAQLARAHGFMLPPAGKIESRDLARFLEQLEGHPERRALNQLMLRAMMQAVYSAESVGHYGLGATHYLHFTSPIRRYPDLIVHRLLKEHWARGGRVPPKTEREQEEERLEALAVQSSERERAAVDVEREVVAFYQTLLMKDRVGEEFAATVASVTDFGFFVELDELHVEGLVKGETLGPDFDLDLQQHALVWPNGRRVKVGEKLTVQLLSANVQRRQLDFAPVAFEGEAPLRGGPSEEEEAPPRRRAEAPGKAPRHEEEAPARAASPHPGFDRLRALAAQKGKGGFGAPKGRGERGGSERRGPPQREEARGGEVQRDKFGNPIKPRGNKSPHRGQGGRTAGGKGGGRGGGSGGGRGGSKGRRR